MKLDNEQKRVLKAALPAIFVFPFASPFFYWVFGKLDSWKDALLLFIGNLVVAFLLGLFYVLGSKFTIQVVAAAILMIVSGFKKASREG